MFTARRKVRYSECGGDGTLTIPAIVNHFQDTSTEHSESLGVGVDYMKSINRAWLLASWQICICRKPRVGEDIDVQTWPTGFNGIYGDRNFVMRTPDGEVLAYANSIWLYLNTENGRPIRVEREVADKYEDEAPYEMVYAPRKISSAKWDIQHEPFVIQPHHLDTNYHVNNSKYIEAGMDYIPEHFEPAQVRVEYKKAALLGDVIVPYMTEEKGRILLGLCDKEGQTYATIEWIGEYKE